MYILGAGMSGCIAAILNASARVLEASSERPTNHNAVLRFRTDLISRQTGIPFKEVTVNKSIYIDGTHHNKSNPMLSNMYSRKVTGKILNRSIWSLEQSKRYVAPVDFHDRLIDMIGNRIRYGWGVTNIDEHVISVDSPLGLDYISRESTPIISTMPMTVLAKVCGLPLKLDLFSKSPITTARCKIVNCDINQTIYYPGAETSLYRATITGGEIILEFTQEEISEFEVAAAAYDYAIPSFGLKMDDFDGQFKVASQKYGKIAPVEDGLRKSFMFEATQKLGIYSLGRFAVWENILLDDVYHDVFAIRRMIEQSHYDVKRSIS